MGNFRVAGCPVADGGAPCPRCGGGWPGTKLTTEDLTSLVISRTIKPEKLGCGPLVDRANDGLVRLGNNNK